MMMLMVTAMMMMMIMARISTIMMMVVVVMMWNYRDRFLFVHLVSMLRILKTGTFVVMMMMIMLIMKMIVIVSVLPVGTAKGREGEEQNHKKQSQRKVRPVGRCFFLQRDPRPPAFRVVHFVSFSFLFLPLFVSWRTCAV